MQTEIAEEQQADFSALLAEIQDCYTTIIEVLWPVAREAVQAICTWYEGLQRAYLLTRLPWWLPEGMARWISEHWPSRWLPRIDWETCK